MVDGDGKIRLSGLNEAISLCEQALLLPDEVFQNAHQLPYGYRLRMIWNVRREIDAIRPRAREFLKTAAERTK